MTVKAFKTTIQWLAWRIHCRTQTSDWVKQKKETVTKKGSSKENKEWKRVNEAYGTHRAPSKEKYMHYQNARSKRKEKGQKVFLKQ